MANFFMVFFFFFPSGFGNYKASKRCLVRVQKKINLHSSL
jgi:hypothetical protein